MAILLCYTYSMSNDKQQKNLWIRSDLVKYAEHQRIELGITFSEYIERLIEQDRIVKEPTLPTEGE